MRDDKKSIEKSRSQSLSSLLKILLKEEMKK